MSDVAFWPGWLGERKFAAAFTVVGVATGTYLYGLVRKRMQPVPGATLASAVSTD